MTNKEYLEKIVEELEQLRTDSLFDRWRTIWLSLGLSWTAVGSGLLANYLRNDVLIGERRKKKFSYGVASF